MIWLMDLKGIQIPIWDKEIDHVWVVHCSFNYSEFIALSFGCILRRPKSLLGCSKLCHGGEGAAGWEVVVKERFGLIRASRCRYLGSRKFTGKTENRFLSDETMDR